MPPFFYSAQARRVLPLRSLLRHRVQALWHVHFVRAFVVALPCLAEQPASVRGVLEVRLGLLLVDEVDLVVRQVHEVT